jgi:hypothetical protein
MTSRRYLAGWARSSLTAFAALTACSSTSGNVSVSPQPIPGFKDTFETTRCDIGEYQRHELNGSLSVEIGSNGLDYIDLANGMFICNDERWPPGNGPAQADEKADVLAYFANLGMPNDETGAVTFSWSNTGDTGSFHGGQFVVVEIQRVVDTVPVPESRAVASLVAGKALVETVYWPALPAFLWTELSAMRTIVGDPQRLATLQGEIGAGFVSGSIVIHHTNQFVVNSKELTEPVSLVAHVCYDALVTEGDGSVGATHCYLSDGSVFTFAGPGIGPAQP